MSPIIMMIFVLIAAALVFMGPDPYEKQRQDEEKYGKDKLVRTILKYNEKLEDGTLPTTGGEYKPPKGAKVYKLPDYMVTEKKEKKGALSSLVEGKPAEPDEVLPPPQIPMEEWGKSGSKSKLNSGLSNNGIKYEPGLPTTFAQPDAPKPVPVEPLGEQ
jgi:hypothetical protein